MDGIDTESRRNGPGRPAEFGAGDECLGGGGKGKEKREEEDIASIVERISTYDKYSDVNDDKENHRSFACR